MEEVAALRWWWLPLWQRRLGFGDDECTGLVLLWAQGLRCPCEGGGCAGVPDMLGEGLRGQWGCCHGGGCAVAGAVLRKWLIAAERLVALLRWQMRQCGDGNDAAIAVAALRNCQMQWGGNCRAVWRVWGRDG